ncbi:MAG: hypothetical protein ACRETQ_00810 [Gammaproteobacteria bacterium]
MTKLNRSLKLILAGSTAALLAVTLVACSKNKAPAAAKNQVLSACSTIPETDAASILGGKIIAVPMSVNPNSPIQLCQYINDDNEVAVLLQISPFKGKDAAKALQQDAAMQKGVGQNSIIPSKVVPATGLGAGAFFVENTTSPTNRSIQLHFIDDAHKLMVQVNNPKDFATGESQALDLAQKAVTNIKDGSAFKADSSNS